jgi:hypothetical protein
MKGEIMKTIFIRALAVTVLASSISAFAASDNKKTESEACSPNAAQQTDSAQNMNKSKNPDRAKDHSTPEEQHDFNRVLAGIYG